MNNIFKKEMNMDVEIKKLTQGEIEQRGITQWPIWEKEPSEFDWSYDQKETCYLLEGSVDIQLPDGNNVHIEKGDYVEFPKGLSCRWHIDNKVRKHYNFE